MAIPIKQVPILSGEIAEEFERRAEERERSPHRIVTEEQRQVVKDMMRSLKEFKPSWSRNVV